MNLAVLAATLVDVVDFFPVTLLIGVSKFLFSSLALAFCLSLLASFVVSMTVIPLFCSRFLRAIPHQHAEGATEQTPTERGFNAWFNRQFAKVLDLYERWVRRALQRPALTVAALMGLFFASLAIYPSRARFLPDNRCGPVHRECESAHRHADRDDGSVRGENRRSHPPRCAVL